MTPDKVVCIGLLLIVLLIMLSFYIQQDYCSNMPPIIKTVQQKPDILYGGEVYHLSNNIYTYADAKKACNKYGGKLATKKQIMDAYKNGANWCSYGWSENGEAYYPIQKSFHDKLDDKSKCGTVGVNGGVFDNHDIQFGANCYGPRPAKDAMKDGDTIAAFSDNWTPDGSAKMETFVCNGTTIPILNIDDGYDKLHKYP
jgi:hypothetical protein